MDNCRFVALASAAGKFLRTPPERWAQAADVTRVERDAKNELNHGRDPAAGPELASEAVSFGATLQESR
jgi:hypothetical protein